MSRLSKKEIILLVVLLFLISGVIYYYYYYVPKGEAISALEYKITQDNTKLEALQQKERQIIKINQEIEKLRNNPVEAIIDIPRGVDEPELLTLCTDAIDEHASSVIYAFNPEAAQFDFFQLNYVQVLCKTSYNDLLDILTNFRNLKWRNKIVNVSINYVKSNTVPLGPVPITGTLTAEETLAGETGTTQEIETNRFSSHTLEAVMLIEFYSFDGELMEKDYNFLLEPINNPNLFITNADIGN